MNTHRQASPHPLRILHTEWSDGWGGQERRIISEMAGMARRGHHVVLATRPQCRIAAEAAKIGIPVLLLPMRNKADLASIIPLARYLSREGIQVVNTHSGVDSWIGAFAAKLARTPALVRTRHLNIPLKRNWVNFVHYMANRIVSCGQTMKSQLVEGCGFPPEQVISIPTGIDFARFTPARPRSQVRQELGIAEDEFAVLMVGVIRSVKRHEIALRAFQAFLEKHPAAQLLLAGDGPMRERMVELAAELGIAGKARFLGHREDVPDLMAAADLLLLTSRSEGVPQAVTQALGLGLPVVATAVGGVPELIIHERTGLLVPPEDPHAAAEAMLRVADDAQLAARLGGAGRRHALAEFSLDAMLDNTEALLNALVQTVPGRSR
jgi:glycosyltransferase involved in cell wall biosynthesis